MALAYPASAYLQSLVYGITVHDPLSFALSPLLLCATALAAAPALRATRTDPVTILRQDSGRPSVGRISIR